MMVSSFDLGVEPSFTSVSPVRGAPEIADIPGAARMCLPSMIRRVHSTFRSGKTAFFELGPRAEVKEMTDETLPSSRAQMQF